MHHEKPERTGIPEKVDEPLESKEVDDFTKHLIVFKLSPHWRSLSREDQDKVRAERKKLGITKGGKGGGSKASEANRMKQLAAQNKKYKCTIKALKRKPSGDDATGTTVGASDSDSDTDAGDQFGGKHSKKKKKGGG